MLRFSLRELLLVIVIIGVAVGWWSDRWRRLQGIELRAAAMEFALRQEGWIIYQTNAGFRFTKEGAEGLAYE